MGSGNGGECGKARERTRNIAAAATNAEGELAGSLKRVFKWMAVR